MSSEGEFQRMGGLATLFGVAVLIAAGLLQPRGTHPGDAQAAFGAYAESGLWVFSHVAQLLGYLLVSAGLIALLWRLRSGRAGGWALLAGVGVVVSLVLAAALQAVEGVALKLMVERWVSAAPEARTAAFEAALAVRQIEIGLSSVMGLLFGLTVLLCGIALLTRPAVSVGLGMFGLLGGIAVLASSMVRAHMGYSDIAMAAGLFSTLILLLWVSGVGVFLLRRPAKGGVT